jgi:hypothetical protein
MMPKQLHFVFSTTKMAEDFRSVGYPEPGIQDSVKRWSIYDGLEVEFLLDSFNGYIKGTRIPVHKKWCNEEGI